MRRSIDGFLSRASRKQSRRRRSSIQELIQHTHDSLDVWAVGITIVIGGQYYSWNGGLAAGTVSYGAAVVLMGLAYLSLALSMAEMTSMLPFAGGAYGLARCTLGFYVGFLVGICEAMEYISYVSCSMLQLGHMVSIYHPLSQHGLYVMWVLAYIVAASLVTIGGKVFWHWSKCVAVASIVCIVVFCGLSLQYADVSHFAGGDFLVMGGFASFIEVFPLASWLYSGVESLNMLSNDVINPKGIIPKGQVACVLTLLITSWAVFLVTVSLPPGMPFVAHELAPLSHGYALALNITLASATVMSIPATFATTQGLMMAFTNVISALATSKLLPPKLGARSATFNTPVYATLLGSTLSLGLCIADNVVGGMDAIMFNVSMLFMFAAYTSQCLGYIFLKLRHNDRPRAFRSPVGIPGAVFAICVWIVSIVSITGFQHDNYISVVIAFGLMAVCCFHCHLTSPKIPMSVAPHLLKRQASSFKDRIQHAHNSRDLWAIGTTIVIGGQFISWNSGLTVGAAEYGVAVVIMGVAYTCLACCMAEMSSMLPFAGGVYGLSRCTMGFSIGFVLGCCEVLEYAMYVATMNVTLSKLVVVRWPSVQPFQPWTWVVANGFSLSLLTVGGKVFWKFNLVLAMMLVVQVLVYCLGSAPFADMKAYATAAAPSTTTAFAWFKQFPVSSWFYVGIEAINTLCNEVDDPKNSIPRGQVACLATMVVTGVSIFLTAISCPPGLADLKTSLAVFNGGYTHFFGLSLADATMLSIPACFACIPGFLLCMANIMSSMAESKLIPYALHRRSATFGTPVRAVVVSILLSLGLSFVVHHIPNADTTMYNLSLSFGTLAYVSQCIGYIFLHRRYKTMKRTFHSPFGVPGAVVAITIFAASFVSLVSLQLDSARANVCFVTTLAVLTLYYHVYAKRRQTISEDERKILFFVHVG
ncbi:hypothetical protein DYB34_007030, partial [Aphanomyces astaci]